MWLNMWIYMCSCSNSTLVIRWNNCNTKTHFLLPDTAFAKNIRLGREMYVVTNMHLRHAVSNKNTYKENNLEYIPHSGIKFAFAFSKANFFRNTSIYLFLAGLLWHTLLDVLNIPYILKVQFIYFLWYIENKCITMFEIWFARLIFLYFLRKFWFW